MDEISLLELLELTSEDIVDAFIDKIVDNKEKLYKHVILESDAPYDCQ